MLFFRIYLIGFFVCFLSTMLTEHIYFGNGRAVTIAAGAFVENFFYSFLSWLGVVGVAIFYLGEWATGFPSRGYSEYLYEYEQELKRESVEKAAEKKEVD